MKVLEMKYIVKYVNKQMEIQTCKIIHFSYFIYFVLFLIFRKNFENQKNNKNK